MDLLQTSSELRFRKMAEKKTSNRTRPYRQKLKNLGDAAYVGEIRVSWLEGLANFQDRWVVAGFSQRLFLGIFHTVFFLGGR